MCEQPKYPNYDNTELMMKVMKDVLACSRSNFWTFNVTWKNYPYSNYYAVFSVKIETMKKIWVHYNTGTYKFFIDEENYITSNTFREGLIHFLKLKNKEKYKYILDKLL